jgi:hypothetical protein
MKFTRFLSTVAVAFLAMHLAGCASVATGSTRKLSVKTEPSGAKVTVYDLRHSVYDKITPKVAVMQTPTVIPLRTGARYHAARYFVTIEKPGYRPLGFEVHATVNGWYFGNLDPLLLPFLPVTMGIIDPRSGAMWTLTPASPEHTYELQDLSKIPEENVDVPVIRLTPVKR